MSEEISELLKKALALPAAARAALAGSLLESLDETVDEGAEAAWQEEIARRIQELDSGNNPRNSRRPFWVWYADTTSVVAFRPGRH